MLSSVALDSSPAGVLSAKLSAVVQEHYDASAQQEHVELASLRAEVRQLREEAAQLNHGAACSKNSDVGKTVSASDKSGVALYQIREDLVEFNEDVVSSKSRIVDASKTLHFSDAKTPHSSDPMGDSRDACVKTFAISSPPYSYSAALASKTSRFGNSSDPSSVLTSKTSRLETPPDMAELPSHYPSASRAADSQVTSLMSSHATSQQHLRTLESAEVDAMDLKQKFKELAPPKKGYIDIDVLASHMTRHLETGSDEQRTEMRRYRMAVHRLNKKIGVMAHAHMSSEKKLAKGHINFACFRLIMLEEVDHFKMDFGEGVAEALLEIRAALINDVIMQQVAKTWRVSTDEVASERALLHQPDTVLQVLEPIVGFMILLNALLIGISLDYWVDWAGWSVIEVFFAGFFLIELLTRVRIHGFMDHFFGQDWAWSWFDFFIVIFAVCEKFIALLEGIGATRFDGSILKYMVVLRLARIIRIGRVIANVRHKFFKELTLMINGIFAGLRTLFWASVLLLLIVYAFAVLIRQIMDTDSTCEDSSDCNRGEINMDAYGHLLFGSVARSMLTIFTCFTDSCISPDGTPLIWHLWDTHGALLVLGYVLAFLFVSFGVLSLIMAVFVENTLANAHQQNAERQFGEISNQVRQAIQLQMLLLKFFKAQSAKNVSKTSRSSSHGLRGGIRRYFCCWAKPKSEHTGLMDGFHPEHVQARITQDQFEEMLTDSEVQELLDELDISCISREQLFDIIDADGNGFLAISEIVDGIMKLRGPADKGDGVATVLAVRQLQKQVSKFEEHMQRHFKTMNNFCRKFERPETEISYVCSI